MTPHYFNCYHVVIPGEVDENASAFLTLPTEAQAHRVARKYSKSCAFKNDIEIYKVECADAQTVKEYDEAESPLFEFRHKLATYRDGNLAEIYTNNADSFTDYTVHATYRTFCFAEGTKTFKTEDEARKYARQILYTTLSSKGTEATFNNLRISITETLHYMVFADNEETKTLWMTQDKTKSGVLF